MARIWVVEDDDVVAQLVAELLSIHHQVIRHSGGEVAIEALHSQALPDLVVLDLMMPPPDGNSVLAEIARIGQPPVVLLTACVHYLHPELLQVPRGVINKPFTMNELLSTVNLALRKPDR